MQGGAKLIELSGTEKNHEKTVLSKIFLLYLYTLPTDPSQYFGTTVKDPDLFYPFRPYQVQSS